MPVRWVRVVGVVLAIDTFEGRRAYTVDDGSGACIEAVVKTDHANQPMSGKSTAESEKWAAAIADGIEVGSVADVKGWLHTFREVQINVKKMDLVRCTADEVKLWAKRDKQQRDILEKPWVLRKSEIRKCRETAERAEADASRETQRIQNAAKADKLGKAKHKSTKLKAAIQKKTEDEAAKREKERRLEERRAALARGIAEGKFKALGL